jgi:para-nitrobenzyl esterase
MMLIYGGGNQIGTGANSNYNGEGLAQQGPVVVTMNYRLGPLGFLAHPALSAESPNHVSGNYAVLDAIAALQWIKANIAQFGGDPNNVTVYSQSAGAGIASVLLGSPLAKGLFHKMVLESLGFLPAGNPSTTLAQGEAAGSNFATNLGASSIADLRKLPPQDIMTGTGSIIGELVDGYVLPNQLDQLFMVGQINDVPLLAGFNADGPLNF